ncbi:hypothetical protein ACP26L_22650 [Paenibacillus sp. S-38]|uniref:hypothetical protein n=1 Tax=Paenibacillus sp. S-38 TaxID=3416710 RepID=UPI003CF33C91
MLKGVDWNLFRFLTGSLLTEAAGRPAPIGRYRPRRRWIRPRLVMFKVKASPKSRPKW